MDNRPGGSGQDPMIIAGSQGSQSTPRDKVSSRDLDALVAKLRSGRASTVDPSHRPQQPPNPYPHVTNVIPVTPTSDPDDPIQTRFQREMLDAFKARGRWGLVCAVYEEAKLRVQDADLIKGACRYLIDDHESTDHYTYQLACMLPDVVIESLIRNTLPSDYASNSSKPLRIFVDSCMNPITEYAGIYLNITTRAGEIGYKQLTHQPRRPLMGKWLSSNEVAQMLDRVQMYMDNSKKDEVENTALDNSLLKGIPTTTATLKRRFEGKKEDRIDAWMTEIRRLYCTNIAAADADRHFLRCPSEVGYTVNVRRRVAEHASNTSTTPIFGLVNAITRQPNSSRGFEFPKPWGVVLWPLWLREEKLARVAESFGHVLCSAYWFDGGLNFHGAGYSTIKTTTAAYDDTLWTNGIRQACRRIDELQLSGVEDDRAQASGDKVELLVRLQKTKADHDEAQKKADESAKKLEDAQLPLRKATLRMQETRDEIKALLESIRTRDNYIERDYVTDLVNRKYNLEKMMDGKESEIDSVNKLQQAERDKARSAYTAKSSRQDDGPSQSG